jgi:hypothetical protein
LAALSTAATGIGRFSTSPGTFSGIPRSPPLHSSGCVWHRHVHDVGHSGRRALAVRVCPPRRLGTESQHPKRLGLPETIEGARPQFVTNYSMAYQTFSARLVATLCGSEQGAGVKLATSCTRNRPPHKRRLPSSACASLSVFCPQLFSEGGGILR